MSLTTRLPMVAACRTMLLLVIALASTILPTTYASLLSSHSLYTSDTIRFNTGVLNKTAHPSILSPTDSNPKSGQKYTLSPPSDKFTTSSVYIIQLNQIVNVTHWAETVRPFYISYIPHNIYLIKATQSDLISLINVHNNGDDIHYLAPFPNELKHSLNLRWFLKETLSEKATSLRNLSHSITANTDNINVHDVLSDAQLQSFRMMNEHNENRTQSLATSSNSPYRRSQQVRAAISEQRTLDSILKDKTLSLSQQLEQSTSLLINHLSTHTPLTHTEGLAHIDLLSTHIGDFNINYATYHVETVIATSNTFQQTEGTLLGSHSMVENTIKFAQEEEFLMSQQDHANQLENIKSLLLSKTLNRNSTAIHGDSPYSQKPLPLEKLGFSMLSQDTINLHHFTSVLTENHNFLTQTPLSQLRAESRDSDALLPFNVVIAFTSERLPTLPEQSGDSKNKQNLFKTYQHVQFQSPLFVYNNTALANILSSRLKTINSLYSQIHDNSDGKSQSSFIPKLTTFPLKSALASLYSTPTHSQTNPQHTVFTTTIKHVDTLILSLLDTLRTNSPTLSQLHLDSPQNLAFLAGFIDLQKSHLHTLIHNSISRLSTNCHFIDVPPPISTHTTTQRFILQLGQDPATFQEVTPAGYTPHGPYHYMGINGNNITLAMGDTGIDITSCFFSDPTEVPLFSGLISKPQKTSKHRKIVAYWPYNDGGDLTFGHGSHVGGILAGSCPDTPDGMYSRQAKHGSQSPSAKLVVWDHTDRFGSISVMNYLPTVLIHAYSHGAKIASHSWGCSLPSSRHPQGCNYYNSKSEQLDAYLNTNPYITMVASTGNDGSRGFGTIGWMNNPKNIIGVGSVASGQPAAREQDESFADLTAYKEHPTAFDSIHNTFDFSSMGPAFDGRIKPDIMGAGHFIDSVYSTDPMEECYLGVMTGTSMAAPSISSLLGLMQQILLEGRINGGIMNNTKKFDRNEITNSLLRALLITSGQKLDYRAGMSAMIPAAMQSQPTQDIPIMFNNEQYEHLRLGLSLNNIITVAPNALSLYYITPSTLELNPHVSTTSRSIRLFASFECSGILTALIYPPAHSTTPTVKEFAPGTDSGRLVQFVDIAANIGENIFINFSFKLSDTEDEVWPICDVATHPIMITALEFTGETVEASQTYQNANCYTKLTDFPQLASSGFVGDIFTVRCPPAPTCSDDYIKDAPVSGLNGYSASTPLCRAALHLGVMNYTASHWVGSRGDTEIATGHHSIVQVFTQYATPDDPVTFPAFTANNVVSRGVRISAGRFFRLGVAGDIIDPSDNIPKGNKWLYLKKIPTGPNVISGFGRAQLSTIFPISPYVVRDGENDRYSVERQIAILSNGSIGHNSIIVKQDYFISKCFYVSSRPLLDVYRYNFTRMNPETSKEESLQSSKWTSGPDDIRVTMAYADLPSSLISIDSSLVNDLNLFLFAPDGGEYRGNQKADHTNNVERIELDVGTFTPGMHCAVVHGVNVPVGNQAFSLVAAGRGIEACGENPLFKHKTREKINLSGIWVKKVSETPHCDGITTHPEMDITKSPFALLNTIELRHGGDCFSFNDVLSPEVYHNNKNLTKSNNFGGLRLSANQYEDELDWYEDELQSTPYTPSHAQLVGSGKITISKSNKVLLHGETYSLPTPTSSSKINYIIEAEYKSDEEFIINVSYYDVENYQYPTYFEHLEQHCTFIYRLQELHPHHQTPL